MSALVATGTLIVALGAGASARTDEAVLSERERAVTQAAGFLSPVTTRSLSGNPEDRVNWKRLYLRAEKRLEATREKNTKLRARLSRGAEALFAWMLDAQKVYGPACEGSWRDTGHPYYGGIQADMGFMRRYGRRLLQSKGTAENWSIPEQYMVAYRGWLKQGWGAWPQCSAQAGLR